MTSQSCEIVTGFRSSFDGLKQTGTILQEDGDNVKVHIDSSGYSSDVGVWFTKAQLNGSAGASTTPASPRASAPGYSTNPGRTGSVPATDKGVGAPPDGIYQCNKFSGRSYIHIGTLEIRGGTYKGFSSQQAQPKLLMRSRRNEGVLAPFDGRYGFVYRRTI